MVNQPFCPYFYSHFPTPQNEIIHKYLWMYNHLIYNKIYEIMDNKSKRIGPFKQFLKEQKIQKLNEAKVSLEIDWWDECIVEVMQDLKDECNGFLDYDTLVKYVKNKFQILGRPDPGFDEGFLLQHIKDLIFQHHWNSLCFDGMCSWGEDLSQVQALGLAIGELAKVILDKVLETIKTSDDPIPGETTVSLVDKEPRTLVPMTPVVPDDEEDFIDDLPFERKRPVKKFREYSKALNETVAMIDCESEDECKRYCIDRIQKEVGSLDANEIVNYAFQTAPKEAKTDLALGYVKEIVYDYLTKQKGQVKLYGVGDPKSVKETVPEEALKKGMLILCGDIADQILGKIADINGVSLSNGKVE